MIGRAGGSIARAGRTDSLGRRTALLGLPAQPVDEGTHAAHNDQSDDYYEGDPTAREPAAVLCLS